MISSIDNKSLYAWSHNEDNLLYHLCSVLVVLYEAPIYRIDIGHDIYTPGTDMGTIIRDNMHLVKIVP